MRWPSRPCHELVDHLLLACLVEVDGELVALDMSDAPIAEFLMEDAFAARELRGAGVGGLHRIGLRLDQRWARAHAAGGRAVGLRAAPAGTVVGARELLRLRVVSEADIAAI